MFQLVSRPCSALSCSTARAWVLAALAGLAATACGDDSSARTSWACAIAGDAPDSSGQIGCQADFDALASEPLVSTLPGARSVKTSVDREYDGTLSFQNSTKYPIHWDFLSSNRSVAQGFGRVPALAEFNQTEYYSPSRRFALGALTHYEGPDRWVYEIAPYDTADADLIREAFDSIRANTFIGDRL